MFWLLAFVTVGGVAAFVDSYGLIILVAITLAPIVSFLYELINGFNAQLGINLFMVHSWQFLSGVESPDQIIPYCPPGGIHNDNVVVGMILYLLLMIIAIGNGIIGLVAILGMPAGFIGTTVGGVMSLVSREMYPVQMGLATLATGIGATVVAGIVMRIMHFIATNYAC